MVSCALKRLMRALDSSLNWSQINRTVQPRPEGYFAARGILRARLGARLTGLFALGLSQAEDSMHQYRSFSVGGWQAALVRLARGLCGLVDGAQWFGPAREAHTKPWAQPTAPRNSAS